MNEKAERYRGTDKCNCPGRLALSLDPDQWTTSGPNFHRLALPALTARGQGSTGGPRSTRDQRGHVAAFAHRHHVGDGHAIEHVRDGIANLDHREAHGAGFHALAVRAR